VYQPDLRSGEIPLTSVADLFIFKFKFSEFSIYGAYSYNYFSIYHYIKRLTKVQANKYISSKLHKIVTVAKNHKISYIDPNINIIVSMLN